MMTALDVDDVHIRKWMTMNSHPDSILLLTRNIFRMMNFRPDLILLSSGDYFKTMMTAVTIVIG